MDRRRPRRTDPLHVNVELNACVKLAVEDQVGDVLACLPQPFPGTVPDGLYGCLPATLPEASTQCVPSPLCADTALQQVRDEMVGCILALVEGTLPGR